MWISLRRFAVPATVACAVVPIMLGQTSTVASSITGVVHDANGQVLPNATVEATETQTGFMRTVQAGSDGQYAVPLLPEGVYRITVTAPSFQSYQQNGITVRVGQSSPVDVMLRPGSASETVTVTADASILNTETFDVSDGLNQKSMENMPITSRNSFNLALLVPGLNGTRDDEFGNPTFAFGGMQRKAFMIDGIDNTQRGGPGRLGIFSPEDVKETRVVAGAMDAQYGRTVGGIINMVTRGGTNETHGEGLVLERRPGLISKPSLSQTKPFQQWATYSVNIGGPIKRDRLFYFLSGEYEPEDGAHPITITAANAAALGLPASQLGNAPFKQRFQSYLGRIDWQLNPKDNFYFRYSLYKTPSQFNTSGGLQTISSSNNYNDHDYTGATQWSHIVSSRALNELRFGTLRRIFDRPPVSGVVGPVISISGVATLGSNTSANQHYEEDQYNIIDDYSYTAGKHQLRFGTDIDTIHVLSIDRLTDTYSFSNLAQYLGAVAGRNNYNTFTQQFGNNTAEHRTTPINFYAQDHWQASPSVSLNYGVRYEYRFYPQLNQNGALAFSRTLPNDPTNVAPRIGFTLRAGDKTVVRGGYGINYDTLNLRLISLVDRSNGAQVQTFTVSGTAPGAPQYPAAFSGPATTFAVKTSVYGFAPNFRTQYAQQSDLEVERELGTDYSVTVGSQLYLGRRAPLLIDTNLGAVTGRLADGRAIYGGARPNTAFNQIFQLTSVGGDTYYGGYIDLKKRLSRGVQFDASYTVGWAFNNNDAVGDSGNNVTDSGNITRDYGFSSSDQRHRFVIQGVWQPRVQGAGLATAIFDGFMFSTNATVTSGFPYSPLAGADLNGDGVNNDYANFGARNSFRGPMFREWNMRGSRTFPIFHERVSLELIAEAENLLNSTNVACSAGGCGGAVNTTYGTNYRASAFGPVVAPTSTTFGTAASAFNSRQVQLGGRIRF